MPVTPPPLKPKPVAPPSLGSGQPPRIGPGPAALPQGARPGPKSGNPGLWIGIGAGVCLLIVAALVGFSVLRKIQARAQAQVRQARNRQNAIRNFPDSPLPIVRQRARPQASLPPQPSDPKVTTDPLTATIPDAPVSGTVKGGDFSIDEAVISNTGFQLKQGKEFFPDASLNFFLFLKPGEKLDGRKIVIAPTDKAHPKPHIHVARKEQNGGVPRTTIATDNYALRVEFGERNGNKIPGRIFLEMGESLGTKIAGTFEAKASP